jgi:hypothetical protein
MNEKSPYIQQRSTLRLAVIWFFLGGVVLGLLAFFFGPNVALPAEGQTMPLFLGGAALLIAGIGFPVGVKPLLESLQNHNDFKSDEVKSKIIITGAIYELATFFGVAAWAFFKAWYVYLVAILVLAAIVFFVLVPSVNKLYDFLELALQRKNDGGTVAVAKKTTYEL